MALILECVGIVPEGNKYVAYIQLSDGGVMIEKKAIAYDGKDIGDKATQKFKARVDVWLEERARLESVKREINDTLLGIKLGGKEGSDDNGMDR